MIRIVADTNILISGFISPKGAPAKIINLWREGKFVLATSKDLIKELRRVLAYPRIAKKYKLSKKTVNNYLRGFYLFGVVCRPVKKVEIIKDDPEDNKFLETALAGKVDYLVSGDKHFLKLKEFRGIKILAPRPFLERLKLPLDTN
ncbi:putative toxin-antitoxin system toxin component, PIN family [Candidatus Shapirobacteria bacterium]|nr:putative toxin-antitoxin system toxin component, PIN family [Candidatus Shapirobacteria bacterium]